MDMKSSLLKLRWNGMGNGENANQLTPETLATLVFVVVLVLLTTLQLSQLVTQVDPLSLASGRQFSTLTRPGTPGEDASVAVAARAYQCAA
jgi:hypothetical protein